MPFWWQSGGVSGTPHGCAWSMGTRRSSGVWGSSGGGLRRIHNGCSIVWIQHVGCGGPAKLRMVRERLPVDPSALARTAFASTAREIVWPIAPVALPPSPAVPRRCVARHAPPQPPPPSWHCSTPGPGLHTEDGPRDASEGKGPQRRPQKRLDGRLEEVAKAVGGGCRRLFASGVGRPDTFFCAGCASLVSHERAGFSR